MRCAGSAGSGWESQSISALYNVSAASTTYVLAFAQNNSIPIYSINSTNVDAIVPMLQLPAWASWIRDYIRGAVASGYVVVIPERDVTINQWHGVGFAVLDPRTGLGAYLITGYLAGNATAANVAHGGMGTVAMNMSESRKDFEGNSGNLSEGLRNATEPNKRAAAEEMIAAILELYERRPEARVVIWGDILLITSLLRGTLPPWQYLAILATGNVVVAYIYGTNIAIIFKKLEIVLDPAGEVIITGRIQ